MDGNTKSGRSCTQRAALPSGTVEPVLGLFVMREALFFCAKCFGVIKPPTVDQPRRMFDVKHLMIEDEFNKPFGHLSRVERLADDDGVVYAVVMAEYGARAFLRPGKRGLRQPPVEVSAIQTRKHLLKIIQLSACGRDSLATALSAREIGRSQDFGLTGIVSINPFVQLRRAPSQKFGDENKCKCAMDIVRSITKNVGDANINPTGSQTDCVIHSGIRVVTNINVGHGPSRGELPECVDKKRAQRCLFVSHKSYLCPLKSA